MEPEIYTVDIEFNGQTQKQTINASPLMAQSEFIQIIQQLAGLNIPARVRFCKNSDVWCQFDNTFKSNEIYAEFRNNAYEAQKQN